MTQLEMRYRSPIMSTNWGMDTCGLFVRVMRSERRESKQEREDNDVVTMTECNLLSILV